MRAYPSLDVDANWHQVVLVRLRMDGVDSSVGHLHREIQPGETWGGLSFKEWMQAIDEHRIVDLPDE